MAPVLFNRPAQRGDLIRKQTRTFGEHTPEAHEALRGKQAASSAPAAESSWSGRRLHSGEMRRRDEAAGLFRCRTGVSDFPATLFRT